LPRKHFGAYCEKEVNWENHGENMKIKTGGLFLVLGLGLSAVIVVVSGCTAGPDTSARKHAPVNPNPTWSGDQHDPPVYTSPANPDKKDLSAPP
jgi:hypothetical protein